MMPPPPTTTLFPYTTLFRSRHPDELEPERPHLHGPALRVDLAQLGRAQQPVLVELRLDEAERQASRPDLVHPHLAHQVRSEEHTSELQSRQYLVCRLLLEKK